MIQYRVRKSFFTRNINFVHDDNDVAVDIDSVCCIYFVLHAITNKKDGSRNNTVNG